MTKPTTPRHSKKSKPVTLDLEAKDVTRAEEGSDGKDEVSTAAPQSPPSSEDRSAPASDTGKTAGDGASKTAASGLGVASTSDVKTGQDTKGEDTKKAGDTAASGLSASQTSGSGAGKASSSKPSGPTVSPRAESSPSGDQGKDMPPLGGRPTTASAMGSASSAAAASAAAGKSTSGPAASSSGSDGPSKFAKAPEKSSGGGSSGGAVIGGVVGAALGIAALFGLQAANLLPAPGTSSDGTETAALENEISTLRASLDELRSGVAAASGGGDTSDIASRLDALESSIASGSGSADAGPALNEFSNRLDQLSERVEGLTGGEGDSSGIREQIAGLSGRVDDISGSLSEVQTKLGELGSRIDTVEQGQSDLSASLTGRIEKAEQAIEEPGREMEMARAIAVSGLKAAVDRGGSFAPELEAFASVAPDNPAVGGLREFAATGVPTRAQLVEHFPDAAQAMIAAMDPVPENAGILDRLAASAKSMVTVRKVGDVEGDSTEAIAARLESHLKNDNLEAAVAEWNALPDEAKAAASDFGKGLIARTEVEKLLTDVQLPAVAGSQPELEPAVPDEPAPAEAPSEETAPSEPSPGTETDTPAETPAQSE
ncbi:MAG: hypothetical protein CML30_18775 [Rhizobiales bacterium]|nr:hypothetical protein [Hyphomicrobiales bacterium]